jgi:ATP phosphoribosyltransferase
MIKIAIQKSGRLFEDSVKLLKDCGLTIEDGLDSLKAEVKNFKAEVLFLRNSDIPKYLEDGVADIAIIGENVLYEKGSDVEIITRLGFSKCRLSIAVPREVEYGDYSFLEGKKIATSYPNSLKQFLSKHNVNSSIHLISGSVEIAPNIGLADAICDLVSSGNTLFKNGLVEKDIILKSEAVLAVNKSSYEKNKDLIDLLKFRIESVLKGRQNKYILFNLPNDKIAEAASLLPGLKSPTVLPLYEEGWSSIHSVISEVDFWGVLQKLKEIGAEGILVIPIEKMIS